MTDFQDLSIWYNRRWLITKKFDLVRIDLIFSFFRVRFANLVPDQSTLTRVSANTSLQWNWPCKADGKISTNRPCETFHVKQFSFSIARITIFRIATTCDKGFTKIISDCLTEMIDFCHASILKIFAIIPKAENLRIWILIEIDFLSGYDLSTLFFHLKNHCRIRCLRVFLWFSEYADIKNFIGFHLGRRVPELGFGAQYIVWPTLLRTKTVKNSIIWINMKTCFI